MVDNSISPSEGSAGEEFFQLDACQGRPMVRCPSVPLEYLCTFPELVKQTFYLDPPLCALSYVSDFHPCSSVMPAGTSTVSVALFDEVGQPGADEQ